MTIRRVTFPMHPRGQIIAHRRGKRGFVRDFRGLHALPPVKALAVSNQEARNFAGSRSQRAARADKSAGILSILSICRAASVPAGSPGPAPAGADSPSFQWRNSGVKRAGLALSFCPVCAPVARLLSFVLLLQVPIALGFVPVCVGIESGFCEAPNEWRRRESNPRPKMCPAGLLRV